MSEMVNENLEQFNEMGVIERFLNIIFEPRKVFENIVCKQKLLLPIIIIMAVYLIISIIAEPYVTNYTRSYMEKLYKSQVFLSSQQMITKDNADQYIEKGLKYQKFAQYIIPILYLLRILTQTAVFFVLLKLLGGKGTFKQTFAVITYSYFVKIIGAIVATINIIIMGKVEISNSIALLMNDDKTSFLYNFANTLDVFDIWTIIIIGFGLGMVHKVSNKKAVASILTLWMISMAVYAGYLTFSASQLLNKYGITM